MNDKCEDVGLSNPLTAHNDVLANCLRRDLDVIERAIDE